VLNLGKSQQLLFESNETNFVLSKIEADVILFQNISKLIFKWPKLIIVQTLLKNSI